ncbi:related to transforming protein rho [Ramularia collo-cygni]|uniref:Related to transforming protein rho n=1 Tax=Ramularia collo-cygni TaxID=112498 RepID=A0A2D3V6G0_9PEZI|nr:related to transforming protein rho [Ramularia collo-cygni]CZT21020.1 related to transforming protein rho [Ramularia collo-cygni]
MMEDTRNGPVIPILLLGDSSVGKSTFLSRLSVGHKHKGKLPQLHDLEQPFAFNISLYNRPYRFEFYDTASPENYTLLKPTVIILCYSIADPVSLANLKSRWKPLVDTQFNVDEAIPTVVLGLQRDVRSEEDYSGTVRKEAHAGESDDDDVVLNGRTFTYPQDGLRLAQEMRCDRYCECSALTGELCEAVIEDISRTAAKTTTEKGGKTEGGCIVM